MIQSKQGYKTFTPAWEDITVQGRQGCYRRSSAALQPDFWHNLALFRHGCVRVTGMGRPCWKRHLDCLADYTHRKIRLCCQMGSQEMKKKSKHTSEKGVLIAIRTPLQLWSNVARSALSIPAPH